MKTNIAAIERSELVCAALLVAAAVSGCSALGMRSPGVPANPWDGIAAPCGNGSADALGPASGSAHELTLSPSSEQSTAKNVCSFPQAMAAISRAQSFCMDLREYYERGGEITGTQRLAVGVIGTLAGSVFSIIAGGNAVKAWAGLSGATNGIQTQISSRGSTRGGPAVVEKIANAQLAFATQVVVMLNERQYDQIVSAAVVLPGQCSAQAGLGLVAEASAAAAAASAASAADRAASAAESAASAARKAASPTDKS